jgi:hypothetical protein
LTAVFVVLSVLWVSVLPAWAIYGGGSGTAGDPFIIDTPAKMNDIGLNEGDWDKHFRLIADVNLADYTGESFNIIGNGTTKFTGVFDGNGHTISNFTYTTAADDINCIGLFGHCQDAQITDLGLIDPNIDVNHPDYTLCFIGILIAKLEGGTVSNCYVEGGRLSVCMINAQVGGLIGWVYEDSLVSYCHTSCTVTSPDYSTSVAGLVDYVRGNTYYGAPPVISNCYSSSPVSGAGAHGLVSINCGGIISNCHATGAVSGSSHGGAGGLVGTVQTLSPWYEEGLIIDCYATGDVSGPSSVGGFAASCWGKLVNCYATGNVSGVTQRVGGLVGRSIGGHIDGVSSLILGSISRCYATGAVSGFLDVGGLVGVNDGADISNSYAMGSVDTTWSDGGGLVGTNDNEGSISKCYSTGLVSGPRIQGGLVGQNLNGGTVTRSFWDKQTSGRTTSDGGTGKTTAQMKTRSTFTSAGWDFTDETANGTEDIWRMCVDLTSYPMLAWQRWPLGDYYCPDGSDFKDYAVLAGQWRQAPGEPSADIAPDVGDGIVNEPDLRALCDNWLAE